MELDLSTVLVVLMLASFLALLLSGYPVAFVLAGVGVGFAFVGELLNLAGYEVDAELLTIGRRQGGVDRLGEAHKIGVRQHTSVHRHLYRIDTHREYGESYELRD